MAHIKKKIVKYLLQSETQTQRRVKINDSKKKINK